MSINASQLMIDEVFEEDELYPDSELFLEAKIVPEDGWEKNMFQFDKS